MVTKSGRARILVTISPRGRTRICTRHVIRQIPPRATGLADPKDAVDDVPVSAPRPTLSAGSFFGEQVMDCLELSIRGPMTEAVP